MWKKEFATDYVGFTKDGAEWLVENTDIKLVGKHRFYFLSISSYLTITLWPSFVPPSCLEHLVSLLETRAHVFCSCIIATNINW